LPCGIKIKNMNKESQPVANEEFVIKKENIFPICGGCEQTINIDDPDIVYLHYEGKDYHEDCLKLDEAKKESPKETTIFKSK